MKYFRSSYMVLYIGFVSLLQVQQTEARKRRNRHRRHNHLEWSAWTEWSSCTAPCGTGAAYRERKCIDRRMRAYSNKCHGKKHQFKICNTQDCFPGQETLREQLCSKHNNDIIGSKRYRWLPYLLHSARCELTCKASGQGFYNSFPDLIINGTVCSKDGSSVCVEGVCETFGCDGIVGSKSKRDVCGICNGDNSKCKMIQDVYEDDNLKYGYNLVTMIPSGATSINVTQLRTGRNYLALKYRDGKYIINGRRRLSPVGQYEAAGTTFTYKNRASKHCPGECLLADGPTNRDIEVMLLYFGRNTGVLYKFGYPVDQNGMLKYQDLSLTENSGSVKLTNGRNGQINTDNYINSGNNLNQGSRSQNYDQYNVVLGTNGNTDRQRNGIGHTNRNRHSNRNGHRNRNRNTNRNTNREQTTNGERSRNQPINNRILPQQRYEVSVVIGETERKPNRNYPIAKKEKSYYITSLGGKSKFPGYTQSFPFMSKMKKKMHKNGILGNGQNDPMYTDSGNGRRPIVVSDPIDPETVPVIYNWKVIGYTDCNRTCGSGIKQPVVKCVRDSKEVTEKYCEKLPKPDESPLECNTQPCPASWEASSWSPCSATCDEGIQIRNISCLKEVSDSFFLESPLNECETIDAPETSRSCKVKNCFTWSVSPWSECSTHCGEGLRTRVVNCTSVDGYTVNDLYCNRTEMPPEEEGCYSSACQRGYNSDWYYTEWQEDCPVTCGYGKQKRRVVCVSENPYGPDCEENDKPEKEKSCRARESCNGYWFSGPWEQCNSTCGEGVRKRKVLCLRPNGNTAYEIIPDDYCNSDDKPIDNELCTSPPCPPEWFMAEWSECSVSCGRGERSREVLCIDTDNREVNACDSSKKPSSIEECGTTPCDNYRAALESCKDTYPRCDLVVQADMCKHHGYRSVCCVSCSLQA